MGRPVKAELSDFSAAGVRHFVTPTGQLVSVGQPVDLLDYIPSFAQSDISLDDAKLALKRAVDFTAALTALLLLAPLRWPSRRSSS